MSILPRRLLHACLGLLLVNCSGSSGVESPGASGGFRLLSVSVPPGATWKVNQPIELRFSEEVDLASVSLNTLRIRTAEGEPASGSFELATSDATRLRFLPSCPRLDDFSDAGLRPGSEYLLAVGGAGPSGPTVLSTSGERLVGGLSVPFSTPDSSLPTELFLDTVPGPPRVQVRGRSGVALAETEATYLEVTVPTPAGGFAEERVYFRWDDALQEGRLEATSLLPTDADSGEPVLPLNLYSQPLSRVALWVHLNQPVIPSSSNISEASFAFEYREGQVWQAISTAVTLESNCSGSGASVRLVPRGILPQGRPLRLRMRQGLQDLAGNPTFLDAVNFARAATRTATNPVAGDDDPARSADEYFEGFLVGGEQPGSLEDTTALFGVPAADWGQGELRASFAFAGSGGPGGDFSWIVPAGTTVILDSSVDSIVGGPGGVPTTSQTIIGGVLDVFDLTIEEGANLLLQGPNPLTILAAGRVRIDGTLSVGGTNASSSSTLNTTNLPEPGGSGQGGGGTGGTASFLTSQSTPRGGAGAGAFQIGGAGGQGGESNYHPDDRDSRRGSGGGGGRLGPNVIYPFDPVGTPDLGSDPLLLCQTVIGLDGESGFDGGPGGSGAESQVERARGGDLGPAPFVDAVPYNDFLGAKIRSFAEFEQGRPVLREELVLGELTKLLAGAGGGAGGDAVRSDSFPLVPFLDSGDEKGAGGGGGAGGLRILAIGDVIIGPLGRVQANGGSGGAGENVSFLDRVGGGGGGGSGGHVVISSAGALRFEGTGASSAAGTSWYNDATLEGRERTISAVGGQGGAGHDDLGGATSTGGTTWFCDAIPFEGFQDVQSGALVEAPPLADFCFRDLNGVDTSPMDLFNWADPDRQALAGAGGDGSPGLIQVHVGDPSTDIIFPAGEVYGQGAPVTRWFAPPPHGWNAPSGVEVSGMGQSVTIPPDFMVPFFGRFSQSRSLWIPLGLARVNSGDHDPAFRMFGLDDGFPLRTGDVVDTGAPLWGPEALTSDGLPRIQGVDRRTLVVSGSAFEGEERAYLRNPSLLRAMTLRLYQRSNPELRVDYEIAVASYFSAVDELQIEVDGNAPLGISGVPDLELDALLLRRDFRLATNGASDVYPFETQVRLLFQATVRDLDGQPSESAASDLTADITDLNRDPDLPGNYVPWDFIRFEIRFDLNAAGSPEVNLATSPRPALRFLRLPFSF